MLDDDAAQWNLNHYSNEWAAGEGGTAKERDLRRALMIELRKRWPERFHLGPQVRLDAGNTRQLDYIAMRTSPDHPFEFHGFDVKSSRSDLLRELGDARKLDDFAPALNFLWILADSADILDKSILSHPFWKQHRFGLAVHQRGRIYTIHSPFPRGLDQTWYIVHENARRRSEGLPQRADAGYLAQAFRDTEWFDVIPQGLLATINHRATGATSRRATRR